MWNYIGVLERSSTMKMRFVIVGLALVAWVLGSGTATGGRRGSGSSGSGGRGSGSGSGSGGPPSVVEVVLWKTSADLDGDGRPEPIALTSRDATTSGGDNGYANTSGLVPIPRCKSGANECKVQLKVAAATHALTIEAGYFGAVGIEVIDIDRKHHRRALLVRTNGGSGEDPPFDAALVFYRGKTLRHRSLADPRREWATVGDVTSNGKGAITVRYDHCPDATTVRYQVLGDTLQERGRRTVRVTRPDDCSACPHVYVTEHGQQRYRGEILRNLHQPSLRAVQAMSLGSVSRIADAGVLRLEVREEKPETTYLDHIYLDVDGELIAPLECAADGAWCEDDRRYHVLRQGERLQLSFPVEAARQGFARLVAVGYYVPSPSE